MGQFVSLQRARSQPTPDAVAGRSVAGRAVAGPRHADLARVAAHLNAAPVFQRAPQPDRPPANRTGLPDALKSGMEAVSGLSLDRVRVHRNSAEPATLQAAAFARGPDIHVAPGAEHHLPHELGHVVQQMRGEVRRTTQFAGVPINDDPKLEAGASALGARALQFAGGRPAAGLRQTLLGSTSLTPVQMVRDNELAAMAVIGLVIGALLGLKLGDLQGGLIGAVVGALIAFVVQRLGVGMATAGRLLRGKKKTRGTLLEGLSENQIRPTLSGTLEGFMPGKSRHKTVTEQAFANITKKPEAPHKNWHAGQKAIEGRLPKVGLDAKLQNDVFVAQIMADPTIMREAVAFLQSMSVKYGRGGARARALRGHDAPMQHMWPVQTLTGTKNTDYRSWISIVVSLGRGQLGAVIGAFLGHLAAAKVGERFSPEQVAAQWLMEILGVIGGLIGGHLAHKFVKKRANPLSHALEANKRRLGTLAAKQGGFTHAEVAYILRAMGQLRDVMKVEKGNVSLLPGKRQPGLVRAALSAGQHWDGQEQLGIAKKNRIAVRPGNGGNDPESRLVPREHNKSRSFVSRFGQPYGTWVHDGAAIYRIQDDRKGTRGKSNFDYLQGTSGTTLDMLNFFLAHGATRNQAAMLMQAFYANWHAVVPDGMAHSQVESMGVMLQYLYRTNLKMPFMRPIRSGTHVKSMTQKGFASPLSDAHPGYLALEQGKAEDKAKKEQQ